MHVYCVWRLWRFFIIHEFEWEFSRAVSVIGVLFGRAVSWRSAYMAEIHLKVMV